MFHQHQAVSAAPNNRPPPAALIMYQASFQSLHRLVQAFPAAVAPAIAAAIAAAPPFWFCVACPIVLGLLAPLVINFGLAALAQQVCDHFSMDATECFDLW
jgi:hypothetical protein